MSKPLISPIFSRSFKLSHSLSRTMRVSSSNDLSIFSIATRILCVPLREKFICSRRWYAFFTTVFRNSFTISLYLRKLLIVRWTISFRPSSSISLRRRFNLRWSSSLIEDRSLSWKLISVTFLPLLREEWCAFRMRFKEGLVTLIRFRLTYFMGKVNIIPV